MSRARENRERRQDASKAAKDRHRRCADEFVPGEKVLIEVHALSKAYLGFSRKLAPRRDGPYIIVRKASPTTYQVASTDQSNEVLGTYHVSANRKFVLTNESDSTPVVPIRKRGDQGKTRPNSRVRPPKCWILNEAFSESKRGVCYQSYLPEPGRNVKLLLYVM